MTASKGRPPKYDYVRIANAMTTIIDHENKRFPETDRRIHFLIENDGIPCSLSSVVNVRMKLGIPASHGRRVDAK